MPRGLGEDPLSRTKKAVRRPTSRASPVAASSDSSGMASSTQSSVQDGTAVNVSSSRPASYNDVFFRKRSEGAIVAGSADSNHNVAEPNVSASAVAQQVVIETLPPESAFAPASLEAPAFAPTLVAVPILEQEEPPVKDEILEAAPLQQAAEPPAISANESQAAPPPQEDGFLKRIFGRFHR